jgi:hypothetical protein
MRVRSVNERHLSIGSELDGPARTLRAIEPQAGEGDVAFDGAVDDTKITISKGVD